MRLSTQLRKAAPTSLLVTQTDGTDIELAVPAGSRRWTDAEALVNAYDWARVQGMKNGQVVCISDREEWEDEDDQPTLGLDSMRAPSSAGDLPAIVNAVVAAQTSILGQFVKALEPLLNGYRDIIEVTTERVSALESHYQDTLEALAEAAKQQAEQSEDQTALQAMAQVASVALQRQGS